MDPRSSQFVGLTALEYVWPVLLASGASPNGYAADAEMTPLMVAARLGRAEHARLLLDHRADPSLRAREGTDPSMFFFISKTYKNPIFYKFCLQAFS